MACTRPPLLEKSLKGGGGAEIFILVVVVVGVILLGVSHNFDVKIKIP